MSQISPVYGASASAALSAAAWASGACISSAAIDCQASGTFGATAPEDASMTLKLTFPNSSPSGQQAVNIWLAPSEDGTHYADNDQYSGTAGQPALQSLSNWFGPFVVSVRQNVAIVGVIPSLKALFGGKLPRKFGIILDNESGVTISTPAVTLTPVNYLVQ
jgi:hypothetical protein